MLLLKKLKKIFLNKKTLIALFGVVLFLSLIPFAFAKAETCKERLENATEEGVYLYYESDGETKWWRTTETISDICGEKPASVEACPEDAELCTFWGGTKFVKIVGNYNVRLYLGKDCQSTHICFNGPLEESDLKDYGIGEGRINSLRILSKPCDKPGVFIKEDAPPEDYCGAGGLTFLKQWCPAEHWYDYIPCIVNSLFSLPLSLPLLLIVIVIGLIALGLGVISSLVAALLSWVIYVCLTVPIISADVVQIGWAFSRDFVNMLFILILVIIGLATILRIESYGLKKTLPTLLLIALLVNFSLVLVGFIVDISNIVTNFFFNEIADSSWNLLSKTAADVWTSIETVITKMGSFYNDIGETLSEAAGAIAYEIALAIFYLGNIIVYLITIFLLFFRIIALWILAILAPFAFFCYILPATRKGWDMWWKNLLQWSIIGIPLGFFLYLSNYIMSKESVLQGEDYFSTTTLATAISDATTTLSTVLATNLSNLIVGLLAPAVSLVFLAMGVLIALKLAPAGADFIMKGAKIAGGMALKSKLGRTAISKMAGGGAKFLGKSEATAKWLEKQAGRVPLIGKPLSWAGKPFSWGTAATRYALAPKLIEISAEAKKTPLPKGFKDWDDANDQEKWIKANDLSGRDRIRDSAAMGENLEFISDEFKETLKADHEKYGKELGLQKYIKNFYKFFPEEQSEKVMINVKMATKVDKKAKEEAKKNMEREITLMTNEIQKDENTKEEILNISAALKFNIDKKKVDQNLRNQITPEEFKKTARDISAGAIFSKGLEPGDIKKVANPDSLQFRLGTRHMSTNHFRKMMDEWDKETFDKVLNGPGGLRSTVKTQEDLVELFADNPQLGEWGIKSPVGRSIFREWDKLMPKEKEEEEGKKKVLTADEQFAELKELAAKRRDEKREYEESLKRLVEGGKRVEEAARKVKMTRREKTRKRLGDIGEKVKKKKGFFRLKRGRGKGEIPDTGSRE